MRSQTRPLRHAAEHRWFGVSLLAALLTTTTPLQAENLLVNGDFAKGETCGVWCVTDCDIPGWIAQKIDWSLGGDDLEDPGKISINGCTAGSVEQTVPVTPGLPLRLLVRWDAQVNSPLTEQSATVSIGPDTYVLDDVSTPIRTWEVLDTEIIPKTSSLTVRIVSNHGSDQGLFFDYVRLEPIPVDCNGNGLDDAEEIANGLAADCNANGIPDDCDIATGDISGCLCPGDFDHDGDVDGADLGAWLSFVDAGCSPGTPCPGDLDGDGEVRGSDLGLLLLNWGICD